MNGSNVAVARLVGRLIAGVAAVCFQDQVDELLRLNFTRIVLNMERLDLIDCAGLGQIVNCLCKVRRQGGGLRLVHVGRRFREMLALLRLESVLEILESEQAAVSSLASINIDAPVPEQPLGTDETCSCASKDPATAGCSWC
jgi:anti-anti-sigma factor